MLSRDKAAAEEEEAHFRAMVESESVKRGYLQIDARHSGSHRVHSQTFTAKFSGSAIKGMTKSDGISFDLIAERVAQMPTELKSAQMLERSVTEGVQNIVEDGRVSVLFDAVDGDGSGHITKDEFREVEMTPTRTSLRPAHQKGPPRR